MNRRYLIVADLDDEFDVPLTDRQRDAIEMMGQKARESQIAFELQVMTRLNILHVHEITTVDVVL